MMFTKIAVDKMADLTELLETHSDPSIIHSIDSQAANIMGAPSPSYGMTPSEAAEAIGRKVDALKDIGGRLADNARVGLGSLKDLGEQIGDKASDAWSSLKDFSKHVDTAIADKISAGKKFIGGLLDKGNNAAHDVLGDRNIIEKLVAEHPHVAAGAAIGGAGAGGAGLLAGLLGRRKAAKDAQKALGRNKKLALIAALGIPAAAGATYLASKKD